MIQVVDLVAYLRSVADLQDLGKDLPPFKQSLAPIAARLQPAIAWEQLIALIVEGEIQGPKRYARKDYRGNGPITRVFRVTPSDTEDIKPPWDPVNG
jgi:hypothetical protein